jgi:hypothetical protein
MKRGNGSGGLNQVWGGGDVVDSYLWIQLWPLGLALLVVGVPATAIRVFWRRDKSFGER